MMTTYVMCSVLDMTAQQFGRPFTTVSDGSAIRSFSDEVNHPSDTSILYKHPDDFQLFKIGLFDDLSGSIELLPTPLLLISGSAVAVREG